MGSRGAARLAAMLFAATTLASASSSGAQPAVSPQSRPPEEEVIYFLLPDRFENGDSGNDRGGLRGSRNITGFDASSPDYYHGGDLTGLIRRLDYIQSLGATAIWMAPVFRNKPVQVRDEYTGAGYHGYWITDFTDVDPHFGDRAAFKRLVDEAHRRGMKVYMDIITNHTADVVRYRECATSNCPYRSFADYPAANGTAYTPYVPAGEETAKTPAWLNDLSVYSHRGDSTFRGESSIHGDFAGLDDLNTYDPRVVRGMIEIYGGWIDQFGVDGFRIDTAKHVNPEFWQAFVPAMLERARARGIPNFHIFGEVYDHDPAALARHTRVDKLPSVLDFAFQTTATDMASGKAAPDKLARLFEADHLYEGGPQAALRLPTFLGNHDMGRIGWFIQKAMPGIGDDELLARTKLAHALMMFSRGVPTIYYGDEQGFGGQGDYGAARQDMFASRVPGAETERRIGGRSAPFATDGAMFTALQEMIRLRQADPALRRGLQTVRAAAEQPGLFALSRRLEGQDGETLVIYNTSTQAVTAKLVVDAGSRDWRSVRGTCPTSAWAPGSLQATVPALDYVICVSEGAR